MLTLKSPPRTRPAPAPAAPPAAAPVAETVIRVDDLRKSYGTRQVLKGVSLRLQAGKILGVLGSNGAGKTTLLETIEGLRRIEHGTVEVLGHDMRKDHKRVQASLGIQLQKTAMFRNLTVAQTLRMYGRLYGRAIDVKASLERFGIGEHGEKLLQQLSGGMFQRFSLCLATLNDPRILFLDEPTTGLDPYARRMLWDIIRTLRAGGTSIVITTHYLDEAEALCDEVAILHGGEFVAYGRPRDMVERLGAQKTVVIELDEGVVPAETGMLGALDYRVVDGQLHVLTEEVHAALKQALGALEAADVRVANLSIRTPSLEDVFIRLTSTHIETTPTAAARR
ncbi:MAG TPA: ABC transporter ATP-binding protein [Longimicrobium sp.]|uniref:ABC transporter ATP-binding protein n=1 Tax=Longimicrobium sp. TaxID=2029185 RepID=UPI002ED98D42